MANTVLNFHFDYWHTSLSCVICIVSIVLCHLNYQLSMHTINLSFCQVNARVVIFLCIREQKNWVRNGQKHLAHDRHLAVHACQMLPSHSTSPCWHWNSKPPPLERNVWDIITSLLIWQTYEKSQNYLNFLVVALPYGHNLTSRASPNLWNCLSADKKIFSILLIGRPQFMLHKVAAVRAKHLVVNINSYLKFNKISFCIVYQISSTCFAGMTGSPESSSSFWSTTSPPPPSPPSRGSLW